MMMFGLAITTTAAFVNIDAAFLSDHESEEYRRYAARFAVLMYSVGLLWFVGFGSWYLFGTKMGMVAEAMRNPVMMVMFPLTALSPGLPWLLIFLQRKMPVRTLAVLTGIAQVGVIGSNAVSRQWLQNRELAPYADLAARPVNTRRAASR
jgi:cytochrome bd-type quinol oxidase subunit 2